MSEQSGDHGIRQDPDRSEDRSTSDGSGWRRSVTLFWSVYDRIVTILTILFLSVTVLTVLVAAIGRSMGTPVRSAPQLALLFLIWAIVLGADICLRKGEHIRVSVIADALPSVGRKILTALHLVLIVPFLLFLAWDGFDLATGNWQRQLGATGLSYGMITLALPVGALLFLVSISRRIARFGLDATLEPEDHHHESPL
ncbi:TRAP-type C4-dicarboxylate transport system permease small subunit [Palleronia aestuarii]|uniref:TRAP transporter small permease protein n=1 Tax=Palleronia aestuarii TaxID=568105 RepID=A0A2W7NEY5_9RHOB|nr:TRAP transporter small permease [Palleronia aestuarii]PZX11696.1 TRAP-type C4-dicarboxylate transport system permease small subunit [Palleronia aestuarii]